MWNECTEFVCSEKENKNVLFSLINSTDSSRFSIIGQGSLRIDNVQKEDSGVFTCRASNMEDAMDAEASLRVQGMWNLLFEYCNW